MQGDYIWIEPVSKRQFDVAIGARVLAADGVKILVVDDDNKVSGVESSAAISEVAR